MSEKNFASYGDMETLVTEIVDKCGPYTEIAYEDWLQLTPYQQEHGRWDVTGVPGANGTISIDLMTKLWENPNPSASFGEQQITLASDDYDLLLLICELSTTYAGTDSYISPKGMGGKWDLASRASNGVQNWTRFIAYVNDTTLNINDAYSTISGGTPTVNNDLLIPYQIYGIKLHHTVEIKAIAPEVSTLASKCMMSDGETSVEDRLDACTSGARVDIKTYDVNNPFTCPSDGYITAINFSAANDGYICIEYQHGNSGFSIGQGVGRFSVFVKKGMQAYVLGSISYANFCPIN